MHLKKHRRKAVIQGTVLCVVLLFHDPAYDHQADSGQPFDRAMPMNDYMFILFRCQTKTAPLFLNERRPGYMRKKTAA